MHEEGAESREMTKIRKEVRLQKPIYDLRFHPPTNGPIKVLFFCYGNELTNC